MGPQQAFAATALLALLPLSACGGGDDTRTINVLAAASLTDTFTTLAEQFEEDRDGVEVKLVFDSSATLAQQAVDGAPGDVLATADEATMQTAADGDALDGDAEIFASNLMVIVTPPGNTKQIAGLDDLDAEDVTYVACVDTAPCGKVAAALLSADGIEHPPASLEVDVKAVLAKVIADEADAGLVYATDAVAAVADIQEVDIAGADSERATYPIAVLDQSQHSDLAREFLDLVLGSEGQQVLGDAGFGKP